jgi:hypothetical protein
VLLELERGLFAGDVTEPMRVLKIVDFTMEGRHDWHPDPEVAMVAVAYLEANLPKEASWREYILSASKAAAWQGTQERQHVTVTAENLQPMTEDLSLPVYLVVENGHGDGSFLWAVFLAYAPDLFGAMNRNWLDIVHAGGTSHQPAVTQAQANKFQRVCRVLVVKDNDNGLDVTLDEGAVEPWPPGEPVHHMWLRHEVENYLPDAVLRRSKHPNAELLVEHLRGMTPEQQRWIDMKKGVSHDPKNLFGDLEQHVRKIWNHGFGKTFPKPLVPHDSVLTMEDFRSLGEAVHEELMYLLRKIRQLV